MPFVRSIKVYRTLTKHFKIKTPTLHEVTLVKLRSRNDGASSLGAGDLVVLLDGYLTYKRFGQSNVDDEIVNIIDSFVDVVK